MYSDAEYKLLGCYCALNVHVLVIIGLGYRPLCESLLKCCIHL